MDREPGPDASIVGRRFRAVCSRSRPARLRAHKSERLAWLLQPRAESPACDLIGLRAARARKICVRAKRQITSNCIQGGAARCSRNPHTRHTWSKSTQRGPSGSGSFVISRSRVQLSPSAPWIQALTGTVMWPWPCPCPRRWGECFEEEEAERTGRLHSRATGFR